MPGFLKPDNYSLQRPQSMGGAGGGGGFASGLSGLLGAGATMAGQPWLAPLIQLGGSAISGIGAAQAAEEARQEREKERERQQRNLDRDFFMQQNVQQRQGNMQGLDMLNQSFDRANKFASQRGLVGDIRRLYG